VYRVVLPMKLRTGAGRIMRFSLSVIELNNNSSLGHRQ
jgi:hypothetical protein